jgi:hypothetical protein
MEFSFELLQYKIRVCACTDLVQIQIDKKVIILVDIF